VRRSLCLYYAYFVGIKNVKNEIREFGGVAIGKKLLVDILKLL